MEVLPKAVHPAMKKRQVGERKMRPTVGAAREAIRSLILRLQLRFVRCNERANIGGHIQQL